MQILDFSMTETPRQNLTVEWESLVKSG